MPEPKLSPAQFAARIKSQYPEYKDIADDVLAQKVVSKYPEYAESVDFGVKKKEPSDSTTPKVAMESPSEAGSSAPKPPGLLPDFTALRQRQQVEQIGEIPLQKQETYKPTPEQQSKMMRRIADGEVAYVPSPLSQVYEKVKTGVELDPIEQYTYDQRLNKLDVEQKVETYSKVKGLGLAANAGAQLFLDQLYPSAFPGSEELSQYARNMNKAYLISSGVPEEDADKSFSEQKDFINGAKVFGVEAANTVGLSALSAMLMGAPVASFGVTAAAPGVARQAAQAVSRNIAQNPATFATMGYVGSNSAYKSVKNDPTKTEAEKVAYSTYAGLKEMLTESGFIGDLRAWNQTLSAAEKTAAKATFKSTFMDYQKALRKQGLEEGTEEGASWTGDLLWALGTGEKLPSAREGWEAMALGAVAPGFAVTSQYAPALSDFAAGYLPFTLPKSEDITALSDLKKKKEQVDKDLTTEELPATERERLEAVSEKISANIESLRQKSFEERKDMSPEDFTMLSLIDAQVEGLNRQFETAKTASMKVEIKQEVIELLAAKKEIEDSYATPKTEIDAVQEQTAGEVPVQPGATVGEEVAQGEPQAEPQVAAEEVVQEEVVPSIIESEAFLLEREKTPRDEQGHFSFIIKDNKTNDNLGNLSFNYRDDLGGYQVENVKVFEVGTGIGIEAYRKLINTLDKPLISDSLRSGGADSLWAKLEKEGLAKFDKQQNKYFSIKPQVTAEEVVTPEEEVAPVVEEDVVEEVPSETQNLTEADLPGFDRMMTELDGVVKKSEQRRASREKTFENAMNYVVGSNAYETATDVQRESLVRMVNKRFGKRMKSAPSVGRIFDTIKDIKKITMSEYALLKNQIQSAARGAKDAKVAIANASKSVGASIQDLSNKGRINLKQAASLTNRFAKTNPLDELSVERFVNYASKVFSNAEYAAQLAGLAKAIPLAKTNAQSKLGIAEGVAQPIMSMLSISPDLIPDSAMPVYTEILGMLSQRTAVLQLQEIDDVKRKVESVLDAVDLELSKIPELVERFIEYQEKVVDESGKIDFPKTLSKMVSDKIIDENEAEILRNNRSLVIQRASKEKPTEEELSKEKEALLAMVSVAKVDSARLPSRDERAVAATLSQLLSTPAVDMLDNSQLKGLLRAIDNINDGFLPHYAELTVERLNAINESIKINKALESAKPIKISEAVAKVKAFLFRTKNAPLVEMIRRNPLYYLDQLFGNFKDKTIFNSVFGKVSTAQTKFQTSSNDIRNRLNNAEDAVFKSRESDSNEAAKSKYRMMTYLRELEFLSNPGSNQVNPAAAHIQATIDQIETDKSIYTDKEAAMLQEILDKFSEVQYILDEQGESKKIYGPIKMEEIYDSFNSVEKKAIEEIQKINTELRDKAVFTSVIIRGDKIAPLNNYMHLNVLHEHRAEEQLIGDAFVNDYNESLRPSTKAKSLIARTGKVSPINFDVFSSTSRGANYVLMDYFLTEPVRTTRKMFAESQKALKSKKAPKQQREILNAVESVFEESIGNLLNRNFTSSSIGDEVGAFISRQGYRSILASVPRFIGELTSNLMFAAIVSPKDFTAGARLKDLVLSADAAKVMDAVGSKQTTRLYPNESLSGRLIDESIMSQAAGAKGSRAKSDVANKINQIYNKAGVRNFQNFVATASDALISTPDKLIMRPLWFGAFANEFKKQTGKDADFDLIASNNEAYMNANKDALARASDYADQTSVFAGASDNAFMGILKGVPNKNQSSFVRYFNTFNNFMTRFLIYEFVTARTGIYAAMGNGAISKKQGAALLAGATTRMVAYSVLVPMLNELMISVFNSLTGRPDEEEEDEKSFAQRIAQGTTSAATSLLLGRDFGNIVKAPIAYGVERVNQEYLDFLRNGEYDSYKDQIMFTQIPVGGESSKGVSIEDFAINMLGPTAPTVRSLAFAVEKYTAEDKKEAGAIKRQDMEKYVRIPLELAGQAGFVPLYKDIRKILLNEMYKDLRKAEDTPDGLNKMNKKDMEFLYPEIYNQLYGPDSPLLDYEQIKKDLRKEQKILLESAKYDGAK